MKKILLVLLIIASTGFNSKSQNVANVHYEVGLSYSTNYDFDLNKPTGIVVIDNGYFKIDIGEDGRGKFYYLSGNAYGGNSQKIIYTISNAEFKSYSNGDKFLNINAMWEDGTELTIMVNFKIKKKKELISSIAIKGANNEGTLHY